VSHISTFVLIVYALVFTRCVLFLIWRGDGLPVR